MTHHAYPGITRHAYPDDPSAHYRAVTKLASELRHRAFYTFATTGRVSEVWMPVLPGRHRAVEIEAVRLRDWIAPDEVRVADLVAR